MNHEPIENNSLNNQGSHKPIYIGIGEIALGNSNNILKIASLGSCIGLVIYTLTQKMHDKCAIMGHIMLAHSPLFKKPRETKWGPAKYADKAVPFMIDKLENEGYLRKNFCAKMVGGAKMFKQGTRELRIGEENSETVKSLLLEEDITLVRSYTGGDTSMSVSFNVSDYTLTIIHKGERKFVL